MRIRDFIRIAVVFAALGTFLCGCESVAEDLEVDEAENGSSIVLDVGQVLVITLESNPGTGFSWAIVSDDAQLDTSAGSVFVDQGDDALVGAAGYEQFRIVGAEPGVATLELEYRRPWEDVGAEKTFSLDVEVRE